MNEKRTAGKWLQLRPRCSWRPLSSKSPIFQSCLSRRFEDLGKTSGRFRKAIRLGALRSPPSRRVWLP